MITVIFAAHCVYMHFCYHSPRVHFIYCFGCVFLFYFCFIPIPMSEYY